MDVFRNLGGSNRLFPLRFTEQSSIVGVTLGNFDGFHLGHQALFHHLERALTEEAQSSGVDTVVKGALTFFPHPRLFFRGVRRSTLHQAPELWPVMPLRARLGAFKDFGFDFVSLLRFDQELSEMRAKDFLDFFVRDAFRPKVVVVGHDWAFGKGREGTTTLLCEYGAANDIRVKVVDPVVIDGERVSSTAVKEALARGDISRLKRLLGREFSLTAHVVHGEQRGRLLGYPTANLHLPHQLLPADGVYATRVRWDHHEFPSATNIGIRPTFGGRSRVVEVHVLDSPPLNLYGRRVELSFVQRLRDEIRFDSADALRNAITEDVVRARAAVSASKRHE